MLDLEIADGTPAPAPARRPRPLPTVGASTPAPAGPPPDGPTWKFHPVGRTAPPGPPGAPRPLRPPVQPPPGRPLPPIQPPLPEAHRGLPGSRGEHLLQCAYGTQDRARRFYRDQVLDRLNDEMIAFVGRMEMAFIGTADAAGQCDSTFRAGPPGFLHVIDERRIAYPEYRGNGVLASLGNISENPHVALLMIDFLRDLIGLHVNGRAGIVGDAELRAECPQLPQEFERGRIPERWVVVHVEEAYVHCRKHIPHLQPVARTRDWGSDDARRKGGDYFGVRAAAQGATR
ncbi:MAG TPA: pyridoxamine 5'-phosphate oxidase family protein [Actinophytocola sp.]|nr:pyridoxamine 5'-phosphate oxidase family protein [Actinophytocola sp.]